MCKICIVFKTDASSNRAGRGLTGSEKPLFTNQTTPEIYWGFNDPPYTTSPTAHSNFLYTSCRSKSLSGTCFIPFSPHFLNQIEILKSNDSSKN